MTAAELIAKEYSYPNKPATVRYATNPNQTAIAGWTNDNNGGRWVAVAFKTITGTWEPLNYELFVNGKPVVDQWEWKEIIR